MPPRQPQPECEPKSGRPRSTPAKVSRTWILLLVLPYIALCFPQFYTRLTPVLLGFPFFYWYQFAWVLITSALLGLVYLKTKSSDQSRKP